MDKDRFFEHQVLSRLYDDEESDSNGNGEHATHREKYHSKTTEDIPSEPVSVATRKTYTVSPAPSGWTEDNFVPDPHQSDGSDAQSDSTQSNDDSDADQTLHKRRKRRGKRIKLCTIKNMKLSHTQCENQKQLSDTTRASKDDNMDLYLKDLSDSTHISKPNNMELNLKEFSDTTHVSKQDNRELNLTKNQKRKLKKKKRRDKQKEDISGGSKEFVHVVHSESVHPVDN